MASATVGGSQELAKTAPIIVLASAPTFILKISYPLPQFGTRTPAHIPRDGTSDCKLLISVSQYKFAKPDLKEKSESM
jgi:hypothetical protein